MIGFIVQNNPTLAFRKRDEEEKRRVVTAMALLSSFIADGDVITDWLYYFEIATSEETSNIPKWILIMQIVSCICGSVSWVCIASDGRILDWLRVLVKFILMGIGYFIFIFFYLIPEILLKLCGFELRYTSYGFLFHDELRDIAENLEGHFNDGINVSSGGLMFLGILLEDVPQIVVTFLVEDAIGSDGGISNSAYLNIVLAIIDILHKLAQAWDDRRNLIRTGDAAVQTLRGHRNTIYSVVAMGTNLLLSAADDKTALLWDIAKGKVIKTFKVLSHRLCGATKLGEDKIITIAAAAPAEITIFNLHSGDIVKEINFNNERILGDFESLAVSMDSKWFLTVTDKKITRWDAVDYEPINTYEKDRGDCLAILDNDRFISIHKNHFITDRGNIGYAERCYLWNVDEENPIQEFVHENKFGSFLNICRVTSDSFLTCSVRGIQFWSIYNNHCMKSFGTDNDDLVGCLSMIDDNLFASGGFRGDGDDRDYVVNLWNLESGSCLATFTGHKNTINDIVYLPKKKAIATASWDKSIKLWSIADYVNSNGADNVANNDKESDSCESQEV